LRLLTLAMKNLCGRKIKTELNVSVILIITAFTFALFSVSYLKDGKIVREEEKINSVDIQLIMGPGPYAGQLPGSSVG
jgi:hypothetical protein